MTTRIVEMSCPKCGATAKLRLDESEMTAEREQKLELDIAALRAELAILMDLVNEIPDAVLERLDSGKMLRAYQVMSEADKHQTTQTRIDKLAEENGRLRGIVTRVREWAVITNNMQALDVLANRRTVRP